MRLSTILVVVGILLILIPIPILPPLVGAAIGLVILLIGLFFRFLGL
ncbi:hypothetical protein [Natronobacterium texcoconense]|uniref:Uncharacterized protein n=1 Tax=Natronobacterium texcoconense TaxID=1095778 RepID=A0A1H1HVK6_NATTX|nr:hypothetical protein [Natronobacterium texcoconense]SDR29444.1 hypothetical protein SAMN04489842_3084 [Natronobacterium texcoconense]